METAGKLSSRAPPRRGATKVRHFSRTSSNTSQLVSLVHGLFLCAYAYGVVSGHRFQLRLTLSYSDMQFIAPFLCEILLHHQMQ